MALVAVVFGMLFFGILGITMATFIANDSQSSLESLEASQAFYVAEGGMQYVLMNQLNGDVDFSDNVSPTGAPFGGTPISLSPGQFWIEYFNAVQNSAAVRVTARVGNAVRVIQQTAGQNGSNYQYVAMAAGNLNMNSSSGNMFGDVAMKGNYSISPNVTVNGNILTDPNLQVPTIDFNTYQNMCTSTYNGNLTISSDYTGNLCVTGNVKINADVNYTGVLYATGNISIEGNGVVVIGSLVAQGNISGDNRTGLHFRPEPLNDDQFMPAILSQGNVSFKNSDGSKVEGLVSGTGNLDFSNSDNVIFKGSFLTDGNFLMNSATNMTFTFDTTLVTGIPGMSGSPNQQQSGSLSLSGWKTY